MTANENASAATEARRQTELLETTSLLRRNQERLGGGTRVSDVTAGFFSAFFGALNREAEADPEPEQRFTPRWQEWQRRHWERERLRTELREAEGLSLDENDPAPLAREGLATFLEWSRRQDLRRSRARESWKRWR
jgi:hypothetical protein